jgi:hypothetical protein
MENLFTGVRLSRITDFPAVTVRFSGFAELMRTRSGPAPMPAIGKTR